MKSSGLKKKILTYVTIFLVFGLMMGIQKQEVWGATTATSSNAYLKSLSVDPGTMSPEFSSEVTSYHISVAEDVDRISVTCSTADSKAQVVEAGGFKGLEQGDNEAVITVQAEDGTKCTYQLTITRGTATAAESTESTGDTASSQENETDEVEDTTEAGEEAGEEVSEPVAISLDAETIPVGGDSIFALFQVISTFPADVTVPEGFTMEDYTYKGVNVQSAYFATGDIRLLYLTALDGTSADFRIYYEDTDTFMDFLQFQGTDGKFIMPVRYEAQIKIPDNYTGSYLPWGDKVVACYIYTELTDNPITVAGMEEETEIEAEAEEEEQEPVNVEDLDEEVEFYLIYAMNNLGEENFYLYDYVEGTYQRYVERDTSYELDQSYFKYKDIAHQRFAVMCILIVLLVLAVFCIFNLFIKNRELKAELEEEEDDEDDSAEENKEIEESAAEENKPRKQPKKVKKAEAKVTQEAEKEEPAKAVPTEEMTEKQPEKPVKKAKQEVEKQPEQPMKKAKQEVEKQPEKPAKEMDTGALNALEEKIIGQLAREEAQEAPAEQKTVKPRKNATFKMINLSREPEPTGLDDDFEFEFINLDDD